VRSGIVAGVLSCLIVGAAGVVIGIAVAQSDPPESLRKPAEAKYISIALEPYSDPRSVPLTLTQDPGIDLVLHTGGTITSSRCSPGMKIRSGTAPWTVDARPIIALSTTVPLYRDLVRGTEGSDVVALQSELRRLGLDGGDSGSYDDGTAAAFAALWKRLELPGEATLSTSSIVWLPAPAVVLASCSAAVSSTVAAGAPAATTAPTTTEIAIDPLPTDLVPGDRVVSIEDQGVPVPRSGVVRDRDSIDVLLATQLGQLAVRTINTDRQVNLQATLALTDPIAAATIPASSVLIDSGTCVIDDSGSPHAVEVIASSLGRSVVRFTDGLAPNRVAISPPETAACE
jgi:hypothetical protein